MQTCLIFPGFVSLKRLLLSSALAFLCLAASALDVSVNELSIMPRHDGSKLVDISYHLQSPDTTRIFVRMEVSFDTGISYRPIPHASLSGDIGWVVPGGSKHAIWRLDNGSRIYDGDQFEIRITADDNRNVNTNKRFLAQGNADFFPEDYQIIVPLLKKYGFSQTFYLQTRPLNSNPDLSYYSIADLNQIFETKSDMGDHTFAHFCMTTSFPLADGYNSPSNDDLRLNRGDGCNAFGIPLGTSVGAVCNSTYLYFSGASYASVPFGQLSDQQCQDIRKSLSVFRRPTSYYQGSNVRLLEALDYLSNKYLGTSGTGRNILIPASGTSLPTYGDIVQYDANNRIAGGIFQGCSTTTNHEVWERLFRLHSLFHSNLLHREQLTRGWYSSGGLYRMFLYRNVGVGYSGTGMAWMDAAKTLPASVYTKLYNSRTGETRSLYDAEFNAGFRTGFEAGLEIRRTDGRNTTQFFVPNKLGSGAFNPDYDCLATPVGQIHRYYTNENGFSPQEMQELNTSPSSLRWLYDRDRRVNPDNGVGLYCAVNELLKWVTWGSIPKFADDSGQNEGPYQDLRRAMLNIQIDNFFQFCYRAGIQVLSFEDAIEICKQPLAEGTNLFPNPFFTKTIDAVIGSTANPQEAPDGWTFSPSALPLSGYDNTLHAETLMLPAGSSGNIRQYMLRPGQLTFSLQAKGKGSITIYGMKNKSNYSYTPLTTDILGVLNIDAQNWTPFSTGIDIPLAPDAVPNYEYAYCQGRDDQICGLYFVFSPQPGNDGMSIALPVLAE